MVLESPEVGVDDIACRVAELQRLIKTHRKRSHQHLQLAAKVHHSLLPRPVRTDRLDVDVRYLPVEEVGGDYCRRGVAGHSCQQRGPTSYATGEVAC